MLPPTLPPNGEPAQKHLLSISTVGRLGASLAAVVVVAALAITLLLVHGASSTTTPQSEQAAAGPANPTTNQTAVATMAGTVTATVISTSVPGPTPTMSTSGPGPTPTTIERNDVQVTQNQNFTPQCSNDNTPTWTVQLINSGTMTVGWQVVFPPLITDKSTAWGTAQPSSGSLAPGQSSSFAMSQYGGLIPCGGNTYTAAVHLTYPAGNWQPDLPLTYAGVGPVPMSNVVLISGQLNNPEACPASGVAPAPLTFAVQNTGDAIASSSVDSSKDTVGPKNWANLSIATNPPNPAVEDWMYPGETWTVTVSPLAGVLCDGTVYHIYLYINDARKPSPQTMTFTYTFG